MDVKQITNPIKKGMTEASKDSVLSLLLDKKRSEIDDWVDAEIITMADVRKIIKKILYVIRLIVREKI